MKIFISKYRNHWVSPYTILKTVCFWEKDDDIFYNLDEKPNSKYAKWVKRLEPICVKLQNFLDFVHPRIEYVKLDQWDTWSMDHTLAHIVLPMLKQLHKTKHGAPFVDDEDVPEGKNLRSTESEPKENEWDTDGNHFKRWDWILDEMIWAFEQKVNDDDEGQFFDHSEDEPGALPWNKDGQYVSKVKVDWDKLRAHQARKTNGYRLFGKYYEALWT